MHRIIAAIDRVFSRRVTKQNGAILSQYKTNDSGSAFLAPVLPDLESVDRIIRQQMHSDIALVGTIAE